MSTENINPGSFDPDEVGRYKALQNALSFAAEPLDPEDETDPFIQQETNAYAWGKTARLLTETQLLRAVENTTGPFWAVDLCSAYPIFRQIEIGQYKDRCREKSTKCVGGFMNRVIFSNPEGGDFTSLQMMDDTDLRQLRHEFVPRKKRARQLLHQTIFGVINDPSKDMIGTGEEPPQALEKYLSDRFKKSTDIQVVITEPDGKSGTKGNWDFLSTFDTGVTLKDELEAMISPGNVHVLLTEMAAYFARELHGNLRKVMFASIDRDPLDTLDRKAGGSFLPRFAGTQFFESALETKTHMWGDIHAWPFAPESLGFISSIEGWPFYFGDDPLETKIQTAQNIACSLIPGGEAVIFPWEVMREDFDTQENIDTQADDLEAIKSYWKQQGLMVDPQGYTRDELMEKMGDRELLLTDRSPVFKKGNGIYTALTIIKPKPITYLPPPHPTR